MSHGKKPSAVLVFKVAGQRYGLPVGSVVQIVGMVAITRLPKAPDMVVGVIDFNGQVIPIVDARWRLRQPIQPYTLRTPIVIGHLNGRAMGLVVDEVSGVAYLRPDQVQSPEQILAKEMALQNHHLIGIARLDQGLVLILDPATFISPNEEKSLEKALPRQSQ